MTFQNSTYLLSSTYILILEVFDMFMTILHLHCLTQKSTCVKDLGAKAMKREENLM